MLNEFKKINSLKWLPFIGNNYLNTPNENKMLVVGESHYHDNSTESILKHDNENYTRIVIQELAIERQYWGTKIFGNLHKTLLKNDEFSTSNFWNLVCYYNFIQRPMVTNKSRPKLNDFIEGWETFFKIIEIIKPKVCLFIGTSSANSLKNSIQDTNFKIKSLKWEDKLNGAYAKSAIITDIDNNEIKLIFIKHTSQMYSWEKWNKYLEKNIGYQLNWLNEKVKS